MSKSVLQRTSLAERLSRGFLSTQLNSFVISLKQRRYAKATIYLYVRECDIFCDWLRRKGVSTEELNGNAVNRYLTTASRYTKSIRTGNPRPQTRPAILDFLKHLRDIGYLSLPLADSAPVSDMQRWLDCYQKYLADVRGLAADTQKRYLLYASRFLARQSQINWSRLNPSDIFDFISDKKTLGRGRSPQRAAESIRPFLLYLVFCGEIQSGLTNIIPGRKRRSQSMPQGLSESELKHLLSVSKDDTPRGTRNYAILMLLVRLGLRSCEVRALRLEDVDWRNGSLLICAGKTHRERRLPLPRDAAKAILRYLQTGRPETNACEIFVQQNAPFGPLRRSSAITHIIKDLLAKAGIKRIRSGAHLLRHTLATRLVNHGASFFQVADLLGHQSVRTTLVYAKLDLERLSQVALPRAGGDQ